MLFRGTREGSLLSLRRNERWNVSVKLWTQMLTPLHVLFDVCVVCPGLGQGTTIWKEVQHCCTCTMHPPDPLGRVLHAWLPPCTCAISPCLFTPLSEIRMLAHAHEQARSFSATCYAAAGPTHKWDEPRVNLSFSTASRQIAAFIRDRTDASWNKKYAHMTPDGK